MSSPNDSRSLPSVAVASSCALESVRPPRSRSGCSPRWPPPSAAGSQARRTDAYATLCVSSLPSLLSFVFATRSPSWSACWAASSSRRGLCSTHPRSPSATFCASSPCWRCASTFTRAPGGSTSSSTFATLPTSPASARLLSTQDPSTSSAPTFCWSPAPWRWRCPSGAIRSSSTRSTA